MSKFAAALVGSALTALVVSPSFAAATAPADSQSKAAASTAATATPRAALKMEAVKIGFIDLGKVASECDSGKAAEASLKAKSEKLRSKIEAKQKQIEKEKAAIQVKIQTMTMQERTTKAKAFQQKVEEYQNLVRSSEEEMQKLQQKITSDLYVQIKNASVAYAKAHGYTAVYEEKGIFYAADNLHADDLTKAISQKMNEKQSKK